MPDMLARGNRGGGSVHPGHVDGAARALSGVTDGKNRSCLPRPSGSIFSAEDGFALPARLTMIATSLSLTSRRRICAAFFALPSSGSSARRSSFSRPSIRAAFRSYKALLTTAASFTGTKWETALRATASEAETAGAP